MLLPRRLPATAGFTLAEMLVAMALLSVLASVVLPAIMGQIGKGEQRRMVSDLRAIHTASTAYFADVGRWPSSLEHLARRIVSSDSDVFGTGYPSGALTRWKGPYLDRGDVTGGIPTAFGGIIAVPLAEGTLNSTSHLRLAVGGIPLDVAQRISEEIEGDPVVGTDGTGDVNGAVRWKDAGADSLIYLMRPIRR